MFEKYIPISPQSSEKLRWRLHFYLFGEETNKMEYHENKNVDKDFGVDIKKLNEDFMKLEPETEMEMNEDLEDAGLNDLTKIKIETEKQKEDAEDIEEESSEMSVASALNLYLKSIYEIGEYTQEQLNEKVQKYHDAIEAGNKEKALYYRNAIVEHNLKLVVSAAKHYRTGYKSSDFNDAIQAGNIGLIKAVEYYDASRGFHFSTYAWWWIRQGIHRNMQENMTSLRVSSVLADDINKAKRTIGDLEKMSSREACAILQKRFNWTPKHATEVIHYANMQNFASLNAQVGNKMSGDSDSESELGELIADPAEEFTSQVDKRIIEKQLCDIIESLPSKRTADIIKRHYGLANYTPQTYEEIGEEYGVTHQAIQRALKNGLALLYRKPELHDRIALLDMDNI